MLKAPPHSPKLLSKRPHRNTDRKSYGVVARTIAGGNDLSGSAVNVFVVFLFLAKSPGRFLKVVSSEKYLLDDDHDNA